MKLLERFTIICRYCRQEGRPGNDVALIPAIVKFPSRGLVLQFECRQCTTRESVNLKPVSPPR